MANEKRLIDANAYIKELCKDCGGGCRGEESCLLVDGLRDAPTVDAVEVVHGRWEPRKDVIGFVRCSVCHDCNIYDEWVDGKKWNYCPNCGAKMM